MHNHNSLIYIVCWKTILYFTLLEIVTSPNNNEVHIYRRNGNDWRVVDILAQHDLRVTGMDWAPKSNRIVTCAAVRIKLYVIL